VHLPLTSPPRFGLNTAVPQGSLVTTASWDAVVTSAGGRVRRSRSRTPTRSEGDRVSLLARGESRRWCQEPPSASQRSASMAAAQDTPCPASSLYTAAVYPAGPEPMTITSRTALTAGRPRL
jgi:hypothetical protein